MNTKELVVWAARLADEKKAENIKLIDLCGLSSLCDFILIMNATSKPHLEAIEEEISKKLKEIGIYKTNRDGADSVQWRVSDYGGFLVHIMTPEAREFYALDKIFSFGKEVDFTKKAPAKKAVRKPAKKTVAKKKSVAKITKKTAKKAPAKKTAKKAPAKKTDKKTVSKKTTAKKTAKKSNLTKKK